MPRVKLDPRLSALVLIDIQPSLTKTIFEIDRVLSRIEFLAKVANLMEIPVFVTEQNPTRMGSTVPELAGLAHAQSIFPKMAFNAIGSTDFLSAIEASGRSQFVLTGLETHICVSQTAHGLMDRHFEVVVCPDAVSSRSLEAHKLGMERVRDAGVVPAHTESVAYEWIGTADHPLFKSFLAIVKGQS